MLQRTNGCATFPTGPSIDLRLAPSSLIKPIPRYAPTSCLPSLSLTLITGLCLTSGTTTFQEECTYALHSVLPCKNC